jgi:hypothetical protein
MTAVPPRHIGDGDWDCWWLIEADWKSIQEFWSHIDPNGYIIIAQYGSPVPYIRLDLYYEEAERL